MAADAGTESPDPAFLEYLGSWEESDEDWLLFDDGEDDTEDADGTRSDPAGTGGESQEQDDES